MITSDHSLRKDELFDPGVSLIAVSRVISVTLQKFTIPNKHWKCYKMSNMSLTIPRCLARSITAPVYTLMQNYEKFRLFTNYTAAYVLSIQNKYNTIVFYALVSTSIQRVWIQMYNTKLNIKLILRNACPVGSRIPRTAVRFKLQEIFLSKNRTEGQRSRSTSPIFHHFYRINRKTYAYKLHQFLINSFSVLPISLYTHRQIETEALGVTAEALRANIDWKSAFLRERGQFGPKFQVQGVVPHQTFFISENKDKLFFTWCKILGRTVFRFVTNHAFYRQKDGQTDSLLIARPRLHSMQRGKHDTCFAQRNSRADKDR